LLVKDGQKIKKGDVISQWDPFNSAIISEYGGIVEFNDLVEGDTFRKEIDEQTGNIDIVVTETKNKKVIPGIRILDKKGNEVKSYNLPVGAYVTDSKKVRKADGYYRWSSKSN